MIESEPSGAQVRLSNGLTGTTPTSFKVGRKGDLTVTISKEGYETATVHVTTQVAGAGAAGMAGNVLVGGIIGAGVDAFSGGMLEHKPNPVRLTLVPIKMEAAIEKSAPKSEIPVAATATTPEAAPMAAEPAENAATEKKVESHSSAVSSGAEPPQTTTQVSASPTEQTPVPENAASTVRSDDKDPIAPAPSPTSAPPADSPTGN